MSSLEAFKSGVKDALEGKQRKNASDFYGPYSYNYEDGYDTVKKHKVDYAIPSNTSV